MTYEKKSVIELREIAKERKIKGISTLKKKELIEVLENYDQEHKKEEKTEQQVQMKPEPQERTENKEHHTEYHTEHQGRKHY